MFKKSLIFSIVVCAVFCLLSTGVMQPLQTVTATNQLNVGAIPYNLGVEAIPDNRGCNTIVNLTFSYSHESDRDLSNITHEEAGRLACIPEFVTPHHNITLQDKEDGGGEQRGTNPQLIKALMLIDDEAYDYYDTYLSQTHPYYYALDIWAQCEDWTSNILQCGDDYMTMQYGIEFTPWRIEPWTSVGTNYGEILTHVINTTNPAIYGCDVVVLMSGRDGFDHLGGVVTGASFIGGTHFMINVNSPYWGHTGWNNHPLDHSFAHEASHLFGCDDHSGHAPFAPFTRPCCIMCPICDDVTKSAYCLTCNNAMNSNRFKFDSPIVGYATSVVSYFESGGGAFIIDKTSILYASDGWYTWFYSGSAGNKVVLNVQVNKPSSTAAISGTVYLRGYTGTSGGNHLIIFKSLDGTNWDATPVKNTNFHSPGTPTDLNCGYVSNFKYLSIVVINDFNVIGTVYIDSIHVHA